MKVGDTVKLKSGGPLMTVCYIDSPSFWNRHRTVIGCVWFVEPYSERYNPQHAHFSEDELDPVTVT